MPAEGAEVRCLKKAFIPIIITSCEHAEARNG